MVDGHFYFPAMTFLSLDVIDSVYNAFVIVSHSRKCFFAVYSVVSSVVFQHCVIDV